MTYHSVPWQRHAPSKTKSDTKTNQISPMTYYSVPWQRHAPSKTKSDTKTNQIFPITYHSVPWQRHAPSKTKSDTKTNRIFSNNLSFCALAEACTLRVLLLYWLSFKLGIKVTSTVWPRSAQPQVAKLGSSLPLAGSRQWRTMTSQYCIVSYCIFWLLSIIRGVESNFWWGQKELDCSYSTPTYPQTGHLSCQRHSLGIFAAAICVIHNYYQSFFVYFYLLFFFFGQTIFSFFDQFKKKILWVDCWWASYTGIISS